MMREAAILIAAAMLAGCDIGPSCEETGGRLELVAMMPITTMAGNTPIVNMIPIYDCKAGRT